MYNFFTPNENELKRVIQETLAGKDALVSAQTIQTGWTNITMDVQGELQSYIFRFPRNFFFARMMIKDCTFCRFLQGKVSLPIPDMKLKMHQDRPFSVHKKIKGSSLSSEMDKLSATEQVGIIEDLSQFLMELHALPATDMPAEIRESLGDFLEGLASVHQGNYDFKKHALFRMMENENPHPAIVHGDFNPGNVLVDNGHVSGIIDFSFASVSDKHSDLGRFWGRTNPALAGALVESYQHKTKVSCDFQKIQCVADMFHYVEYKYVEYMQSNHPEIKIPESVLQASLLEAQKYQST
ncbi:MAG: phosphotransferase family protein [Alphaproteobacteria bacterium]